MNYELAKELKEAGFPQKKLEISGVYAGICKHGLYGYSKGRESCDCGEEETVHTPSLEELTESCKSNGGYFSFEITWIRANTPRQWKAKMFSHADNPEANGTTQLEAVARLWLALNKPHDH